MTKYTDIKNLEELDRVHRNLKEDIKAKGLKLSGSVNQIQNFYTPANMLSMGIQKITNAVPVDLYLINTIRNFLHRKKED